MASSSNELLFKILLSPQLDVATLNVMLQKLKTALGPLGKDINLLDANKIQKEVDAVKKDFVGLGAQVKKEFSSAEQQIKQAGAAIQHSGTTFANLKTMIAGAFTGAALFTGLNMVKNQLTDAVRIGVTFQKTLADMSAITGVTGKDLENFGNKAKDLSLKFGGSASEQIEVFKGILSRLGPDIAKSPEALNAMTEAVNTLSKASGMDATESMKSLTTAMLQYGVDLSDPVAASKEMAKMMNTMAAGAKEGAAEIPQIASALEVSGAMGKSANVSFEELNASIQVLATRGKYGAEAGNALKNVMIKLAEGRFMPKDSAEALKAAGVDINALGDKSKTLSERLQILKPIMQDDALVAKLFGSENVVAGKALMENTSAIDDFTKKMTGTKTAYDQAATNMNTFAEAYNRMKAFAENALLDIFNGLQPAINMVMTIFQDVFKIIKPHIDKIVGIIVPIVTKVFGILKPLLDKVGDFLGVILSSAADVISSLFDAIEPLLKMFVQLAGDILPILSDMLKSNASAVSEFVKSLTPLIGNLVEIAKEILPVLLFLLKSNSKMISGLLVGSIEALIPVVKLLGGTVWILSESFKGLNDFIEWNVAVIGKAANAVGEFLGIIDKKTKTAPLLAQQVAGGILSNSLTKEKKELQTLGKQMSDDEKKRIEEEKKREEEEKKRKEENAKKARENAKKEAERLLKAREEFYNYLRELDKKYEQRQITDNIEAQKESLQEIEDAKKKVQDSYILSESEKIKQIMQLEMSALKIKEDMTIASNKKQADEAINEEKRAYIEKLATVNGEFAKADKNSTASLDERFQRALTMTSEVNAQEIAGKTNVMRNIKALEDKNAEETLKTRKNTVSETASIEAKGAMDLYNTQDSLNQLFQKSVDDLSLGWIGWLDTGKAATTSFAEDFKAKVDILGTLITNVSTSLGQGISAFAQTGDIKKGLKPLLQTLLDFAHVQLMISQATRLAGALATPQSIATFGAAGFAQWALETAGIEALYQLAKSLVDGFKKGGRVKGSERMIRINEEGEEGVLTATAMRLPGTEKMMNWVNKNKKPVWYNPEFRKMVLKDSLGSDVPQFVYQILDTQMIAGMNNIANNINLFINESGKLIRLVKDVQRTTGMKDLNIDNLSQLAEEHSKFQAKTALYNDYEIGEKEYLRALNRYDNKLSKIHGYDSPTLQAVPSVAFEKAMDSPVLAHAIEYGFTNQTKELKAVLYEIRDALHSEPFKAVFVDKNEMYENFAREEKRRRNKKR
ncbi:MAG: phage tail tape measure protein [Bacteroidota bacterium]